MTAPDAVLAPPCWFCKESRPSQAAFCPHCGRVTLIGCTAVMRTGKTYVLGRHADGGFAVWDQTVARPVECYGAADFRQANCEFDFAENVPAMAPTSTAAAPVVARSYSGLISFIVLLLLVAGIYLYVHAHKYSGCTFTTPGIFEWPSACL